MGQEEEEEALEYKVDLEDQVAAVAWDQEVQEDQEEGSQASCSEAVLKREADQKEGQALQGSVANRDSWISSPC